MKVLITGGAGFIGYHVAQQLVREGDQVIVYDQFLNFADPEQSRYGRYLGLRMDFLKRHTTLVRGDIRHKMHLFKTVEEHEPDAVIHLAALPIAAASNKFSEDAVEINLHGTVNVLETIRASRSVRRFVFASSSMIYGNFQTQPVTEEHPANPIDVYGATKLSAEIITRAYQNQYGIPYTIIRPSAVYGPTDANQRVSQIFVENVLLGKPLVLHNKGCSTLDFSYVEDVASGFCLALKSPRAENETFNITRGEGHSLKEFVDMVQQLTGKETQITYKDADTKRPERGALDITKARNLLGYAPAHSLEDGLKKYVAFVSQNLG